LLAAIALAALLGGCFGGGGDKRAVGTLEETLSYVPADAGLVAIVPTDLDHGPLHDLDVLASRFDRWDEVKKQLEARIGNGGLSFDRVLQPQLGSVLAVAVVGEQRQVSAIRLQDPGALRRVVQHELTVGEATKLPDHAGAFMWRERGGRVLSFNAIAAGHLISGSTARDVTQAIDAHGGDNAGSDAATVAALKRLGEDSLVRVVGDAQRLLDAGDPAEAAELRKLRWIGALGRFQGTAHVVGNDLTAAIRLDSDRRRLTDRDLPLAPGTRAPLLHEIGTALALGLTALLLLPFVNEVVAARSAAD
jgi:hypothetical protein